MECTVGVSGGGCMMLSSAAPPSKFDHLLARPPTPPIRTDEHIHHALAFLENGHIDAGPDSDRALQLHPSTDTPPASSPASQGADANGAAGRKVGFLSDPTYHEIPLPGFSSSPAQRLLRAKPSPRDAQPAKSILKLSSGAPASSPTKPANALVHFNREDPQTYGPMLQSVLSELASTSPASRLDAYLALNGAWQAYQDFPDKEATIAKLDQLQHFLARDTSLKGPGDVIKSQIATQALKLSSALLLDDRIAQALGDKFRAILFDRSVAAIEEGVPKPVLLNHLNLLAQRRLYVAGLSSIRADRFITALNTVETRCSSSHVVAVRLVVDCRLVEHFPNVMLARMKDWLEHVFHGMHSDRSDVRTRAVEAGTQAGVTLGTLPVASKVLRDFFERELESGETYGEYFTLRLTDMIKSAELCSYVPYVWSTIVLFFRNKRHPLDRWSRFKTWLVIIQKCMNSSDITVKHKALVAWNKLVYAVMPDSSTAPAMLAMLRVPIMSALDKHGNDPAAREQREWAMKCFNNLLHYALRPTATHTELDTAWDMYVDETLSKLIKASSRGRSKVCRVLHGLMSVNTGTWNESAAFQVTPIDAENLPRLDPRWVRSRFAKVLNLVEPILVHSMRLPKDQRAPVTGLWQATLQSLADAAAQEVRTHPELREATARIVNTVQRIWAAVDGSDRDSDANADTFGLLLQITSQCLGANTLIEPMLSVAKDGNIEAAPTPSHRPSKHGHVLRSPLTALLGVIGTAAVEEEYTARIATDLIQYACASKKTTAGKVQLLAHTLHELKQSHAGSTRPTDTLWLLIASQCNTVLSQTESGQGVSDVATTGQTIRDAVGILITGLQIELPQERVRVAVTDLLKTLYSITRTSFGNAGVTICITEPLSEVMRNDPDSSGPRSKLDYVSGVLAAATWPEDTYALATARRKVWGTDFAPNKASSMEPFPALCDLVKISLLLIISRPLQDTGSALSTAGKFLDSVRTFLDRCPVSTYISTLVRIGAGLETVIADSSAPIRSPGAQAVIAPRICRLWTTLVEGIVQQRRCDTTLLRSLEPLLSAAFTSSHRTIVNETITAWNATFGIADSLEYPADLAAILRARRVNTDLQCPGLVEDQSAPMTLPDTIDSLAGVNCIQIGSPVGKSTPNKQVQLSMAAVAQDHHLRVPKPSLAVSRRTSPKPIGKSKLRHQDSQINFIPIETSPVAPVDDSQILTEHQKETRTRQTENAQMFPAFSSSPAPKPGSVKLPVLRTLDFARHAVSGTNADGELSTPTALPVDEDERSDYIGSSPTPRSSDAASTATHVAAAEEHEALDELPSSPPDSPGLGRALSHGTLPLEVGQHLAAPSLHSNFLSDTIMPALQLQNEAQAAEQHIITVDQTNPDHDMVDDTTVMPDVAPAEPTHPLQEAISDHTDSQDISRIEDSFAGSRLSLGTESVDRSHTGSQEVRTRKRKRAAGTVYTAPVKKRKQQSPFRRFFSGIFGNEVDEDEVMDDEIVVASSQPTISPVAVRMDEQAVDLSPAQKSASQPLPAKRGRPRRSDKMSKAEASESPVPSPASQKTLKRKSSRLADEDDTAAVPATSFVKDTPAPLKARKVRKSASSARAVTPAVRNAPLTRTASAVVVSPAGSTAGISTADSGEEDDDQSDTIATPRKAIAVSADYDGVSTVGTPAAPTTPSSLLSRLQGILGDCRKLILGSQQHREFDDVLFELRKEVHDAASRGKDQ
ncbi:hypothetical protein LTR95_009531 [Oleoguttula sp. CCFEE 5521]